MLTVVTIPRALPQAPRPLGPVRRARRPRSLDQAATPLIPLRPLTIGEAMDAAFLLVRRDARAMLGIPALVVLGAACYIGLSVLIVAAIGNTHVPYAGPLAGTLLGLLGLGLLALVVSWLQFVFCRSALRTVFGEESVGTQRLNLRGQLRLLGPALTYVVYLWIASSVIGSVAGMFTYVLMLAGILGGGSSATAALLTTSVGQVIGLLALVWGLSWTALVVPIYVAESTSAPDWVGVPAKRTGILQAIGRNYTLLGFKDSVRIVCANLGGVVGIYVLSVLILTGVLLALFSYLDQLFIPVNTESLMYLWIGMAVVVWLLTMVLFLGYFAALQMVFYLDLRMRREGLDLALRFSMIPVPEPNQLGVL